MKKVIVTRKNGSTAGAEMADPTQWIADCVAGNVWGKPERIVDNIEGTYDPADVLENIDELVSPAVEEVVDENGVVTISASPAVFKKMVKLKAEYTIEIIDITLMVRKPMLMLPDIQAGSAMGTGRAEMPFWKRTSMISLTAKEVISSEVTLAFASSVTAQTCAGVMSWGAMARIFCSRATYSGSCCWRCQRCNSVSVSRVSCF